ncbi:hypothetical protein [Thermus altitudinis]|uniref:hypothetical protein n=1 Tax=Thermus altitudinis TaxID=2908145 RepID=UPI001FAA830C|nr:hypothetical protein [Thermus altitudinis]
MDVTNVPGIASGDRVVVSSQGLSSTGLVTVSGGNYTALVNLTAQPGTQDLLVVVVDSSFSLPPKAAKVLRSVNISSGGSSSYTFTASDVLAPANVSVNLPSGFSPTFGDAWVFYLSTDNKGWGIVGGTTGTSALNFSYRPVAGSGSGDRYVVMAVAGDSSNVLERFKGASGSSGSTITLALPNPWPANSLTVTRQAHPTVSGLSYADPSLKAYQIELEDSTLIYQVTLSKGWLGNATTYTVPDLSSQLTYTPFASGSTVHISITAVLSAANVLNLDSNDPASFGATTDISLVHATDQYTPSGIGSIQLP